MNRLQAFIERHVIDRDEASAVGRFFVWLSRLILKTIVSIIALTAIVLSALYILSQTVWQPKRLVCDGSVVQLPYPLGFENADKFDARASLEMQPDIWPWEDGYSLVRVRVYGADMFTQQDFTMLDPMTVLDEIHWWEHSEGFTYYRDANVVRFTYSDQYPLDQSNPNRYSFGGRCSETEFRL